MAETPGSERAPAPEGSLKIWDPWLRVLHWSLAGAFVVAWLTRVQEYELHLYAGYTVLGMLTGRKRSGATPRGAA